eukprot:2981502-Pyramimonas_sp.AAC.1
MPMRSSVAVEKIEPKGLSVASCSFAGAYVDRHPHGVSGSGVPSRRKSFRIASHGSAIVGYSGTSSRLGSRARYKRSELAPGPPTPAQDAPGTPQAARKT